MFKFNIRNTRTRCEICSKLTIKTPERRQWLDIPTKWPQYLEILTKPFPYSKGEIFKAKSFAFLFVMWFNDQFPDGFKNKKPSCSKTISKLEKP